MNPPFADKLPKPEDVVANAYDFAEQLLASQRKFAEDVLKATAPLTPGKANSRGSRLRGARVWSRCSASALSPLVMVSPPVPWERSPWTNVPAHGTFGPAAQLLLAG